MRTIHQLVHTLSYGDAISGEVLALQRCLQEAGFESEVYSINVHPKLEGRARSYKNFPKNFTGEVVLHYSLGSPLNDLYRSLNAAKRGLIYHNLTPPDWFAGVNPRIVKDIEAGAEELPELCGITDLLLADSAFNASEIKKLGFSAEVLELPIDPKRWEEPANPGIASLVQGTPGIHLLHVGRLAPNKCIEDIIKTFYFLHHHITEASTLWLVGIDIDTEVYSFSLKRLAHELGVDKAINFAGCLADSEVRALYENCSAYICMSEHEGFCVPLIEAMSFGLPVIAYAASAVPDTLGNGGILIKEKNHPELAELINEISNNTELRNKLVSAGKRRVKSLSFDKFSARVAELFINNQVKTALQA
ncbi:MAG: glycosyltransferase [Bdellovibrionota bacterium]